MDLNAAAVVNEPFMDLELLPSLVYLVNVVTVATTSADLR
jgi:hypothetical protein